MCVDVPIKPTSIAALARSFEHGASSSAYQNTCACILSDAGNGGDINEKEKEMGAYVLIA